MNEVNLEGEDIGVESTSEVLVETVKVTDEVLVSHMDTLFADGTNVYMPAVVPKVLLKLKRGNPVQITIQNTATMKEIKDCLKVLGSKGTLVLTQ